jgi:hypothetical protein
MVMDTSRQVCGWRVALLILVFALIAMHGADAQPSPGPVAEWSLNATVIETCSCPMFCQCYFNSYPAAHASHDGHGAMERYCRFNRALTVNRGSFGKTQLLGVKFWMAGDLGPDFSHEEYDWAVVHFDPSVTKDRRDALAVIFPYLFPGKWNSFTVGPDGVVNWSRTSGRAEARLDGGKTAEIVLRNAQGMTAAPVIAKNLKYEGAPRNDGFVLMPNEVEAYRVGDKRFEFKGTNGFVTTIDLSSKDFTKK